MLEVGGTVTTCRGEPLSLKKTLILATNGQLHEVLQPIVGQHANSLIDLSDL